MLYLDHPAITGHVIVSSEDAWKGQVISGDRRQGIEREDKSRVEEGLRFCDRNS
jgi:hypothetical protein